MCKSSANVVVGFIFSLQVRSQCACTGTWTGAGSWRCWMRWCRQACRNRHWASTAGQITWTVMTNLSLVAHRSDSWLMGVVFFFATQLDANQKYVATKLLLIYYYYYFGFFQGYTTTTSLQKQFFYPLNICGFYMCNERPKKKVTNNFTAHKASACRGMFECSKRAKTCNFCLTKQHAIPMFWNKSTEDLIFFYIIYCSPILFSLFSFNKQEG